MIIKPEGYTIPSEASRIHGILTEKAIQEGKALKAVLIRLSIFSLQALYLIAHNMSLDEKIVGAESLINGIQDFFGTKRKICTIQSTTSFCKIDGPYGYKWPKLSELHYKLFRTDFKDAHNAAIDINAKAKCFLKLKRLGKI